MGINVTYSGGSYLVSESHVSYLVSEIDLDSYQDIGEVLYIINGESLTIYGDAIARVPIDNTLSVGYICSIGSQSGNNFILSPSTTGSYWMYVLAQNAGSVVKKTKVRVIVLDKQNIGSRSIILIGDSLVNTGGGSEIVRIRTIFDLMTWTAIGTTSLDPFKREGYSGKKYPWFVDDVGSPFTKDGAFNISAYFTDNALSTPDFIYMRLGINTAYAQCVETWTQLERDAWVADIKQLMDGFLNFDPSIKIVIGVPTICENTGDGWEADHPGSPYQDNYIVLIHDMWDIIISNFTDYNANVSICYAPWFLDRDDGYPKTDGVHDDSKHPAASGYVQLGNALTNHLNSLL